MTLSHELARIKGDFQELVLPAAERTASSERDMLYNWLMREGGDISIVERHHEQGKKIFLDEVLDPLHRRDLLLSPRLSGILDGLIHDATKLEISFPVESGGRAHSHVVRLTRQCDGAILVATEDQERAGVRADGVVLAVMTQGRYDPESWRCSRIRRTHIQDGQDLSDFPDKENPISMAILYLWHAVSLEGATVKRYPLEGGRAQITSITSSDLPDMVSQSLNSFLEMIGEFVQVRDTSSPE